MDPLSGNEIKELVIGSVTADDVSPTFDTFRFKANASDYVYPGTLVGTDVGDGKFLIGRVSAALEVNPHESASRAKVREAMGIDADYPGEELSTNIYRIYEADIIEEGLLRELDENGKKSIELEIFEPADMPKAGAKVFLPPENIIAEAMGFESKPDKSLCLGHTRIAADNGFQANEEEKKIPSNVLLSPKSIQRHFFIGGTTGSGKSFATGIVLEEINKFGVPIIILDSQHEYTYLAEGLEGVVLKPGEGYTVRLSSLTETEIIRMVPTISGNLGEDLLAYSFIRLKRELAKKEKSSPKTLFSKTDSSLRLGFSLDELIKAMELDASGLDIKVPSLRIATSRTRTSLERHKFLGAETNWIGLIEEHPVINIECSELDQEQFQLVVATTLRELQSLRKKRLIPPHVIVLDEAHLLVPEGEDSPCRQVIRENVRIGRHYGICMILITQSPVDIDKKTIRQCNTRLIFALEPDQLDSIRGVRSDATDHMLRRLPKMPVGTCILSGTYETVKHAIPIRIRSDRKTKEGGETPDIFKEVKEWVAMNTK